LARLREFAAGSSVGGSEPRPTVTVPPEAAGGSVASLPAPVVASVVSLVVASVVAPVEPSTGAAVDVASSAPVVVLTTPSDDVELVQAPANPANSAHVASATPDRFPMACCYHTIDRANRHGLHANV
jgi:hypothetical protein